DAVEGTRVRIRDTRKTAPGLRVIDKYAVRCGGGQNHRLDLSDGVLIKGNHIALAGGPIPALERAIRNRRGRQPIEIEVRSLEELQQALDHAAGAPTLPPREAKMSVLVAPGWGPVVSRGLLVVREPRQTIAPSSLFIRIR